jgi:hypothetical protein
MSAEWVAATVRARAMARRRLGPVATRRLAAAPSLAVARAALAGTAYAEAAAPAALSAPGSGSHPGSSSELYLGSGDELASAQRAVAAAVLWQVRVLAGWMPSRGTPIARAVVAGFERENIVGQLRRLRGGTPPEPFELGSLSTAWNRVRATASVPDLLAELAASPWGDIGVDDTAGVRDALGAAWLRRLALDLPSARPWATTAAVLLVARALLVEGVAPPPAAVVQLDGVLGRRWHDATTLDQLRAGLDAGAHRSLDGVGSVQQLWSAETGLWDALGQGGARLLRRPLPGPDRVVGALALLAADAFGVRAALAAAATGSGAGEVLVGVA